MEKSDYETFKALLDRIEMNEEIEELLIAKIGKWSTTRSPIDTALGRAVGRTQPASATRYFEIMPEPPEEEDLL
jgi:hypothetical protein